MKTHKKFIPIYVILLFAIALLAGCITKNPSTEPVSVNGGPATNPPLAYIVDPRLEQAHVTAQTVAAAVSPANPYAGLTNYGIDGAFALAALISGLIAKKRGAITDTLAAGIVKAGPAAVAAVNDHASNTPNFASVANALNNATP